MMAVGVAAVMLLLLAVATHATTVVVMAMVPAGMLALSL